MSQYNLGGVSFPGGHTSEPTDPWRSQVSSEQSEVESAASAEAPTPQAHNSSTPRTSGVVRNPSPTTFPEFAPPHQWEWQGVFYNTIKEAASAAAPNTVPQDVRDWVINVVWAFIMRDVRLIKANNTLTLEAQAIHKDFEDYKDKVKGQTDALYGNMVALKEAQEKTTTYIVRLESWLNNSIINVPPTGIPQPASQNSQNPRRIKLPDPLKYSGRKSAENFETWFTNLLIWLDYNSFTDDKDKIRQANAHLEGEAALYMKEYAIKLAAGQNVGTWADYTRKLEMAYKTLDPKRTAQSMLDAHCAIHHKTMITFTESFRAYAPESGYSDEDLIVKIREQRSLHIQTVMSVTETLDPSKIPTTWMEYLEFRLEIEIKHQQQLSGAKLAGPTQAKNTEPKDPNTMDTSARIAHELSPEQDRWLAGKLCLFCGKHAYERGKKCPSPKPEYKGKRFQTCNKPQDRGKGKVQRVRQVDEDNGTETSVQIAALEQAIAALRGMKSSTPTTSSKGKGKVKQEDAATSASASTVKDTTTRILKLDEFTEDFQYAV
ncbi:uncharacterized protein LAESUDRAFT_757092 [Laetiporus sulphureus 93-53]|uniref:Retrotransposon gag domain-containing protein n=1 Tax=Laetiporus sulphureus 93-53 TaxID=1314785 RepID=A0A165FFS8_9APHY|nr:uncharacterized protein LAESUDRAFT_757092 [Laetiporus sulphureus 93-53]KZT08907.1 hypothetical protein LAESUDRAFT_757092 [Laetiporus sulphureus 93-53]